MQYKTKSRVEINGKTREEGAILDETEFKARPADAPEEELSEVESLLKTGHIEKVAE